eukprot:m.52773 g.52773  ORF g.52773 m.52773 type:complete len:688 (-) comp7634_c0_seq1:59-2122(-)
MSFTTTAVDEAINEYLTFRAFEKTLQAFHKELADDQLFSFKPGLIVNHVFYLMDNAELKELLHYWQRVEERFSAKHDDHLVSSSLRFETYLKKLFLIRSFINSSRNQQFHNALSFLSSDASFQDKEWFALPYTSEPEKSHTFRSYFLQSFVDKLKLSLFNFFNTIIPNIHPLPILLQFPPHQKFHDSVTRIEFEKLKTENERMTLELEHYKQLEEEQSRLQSTLPSLPKTVSAPKQLQNDHDTRATFPLSHTQNDSDLQQSTKGEDGNLRSTEGRMDSTLEDAFVMYPETSSPDVFEDSTSEKESMEYKSTFPSLVSSSTRVSKESLHASSTTKQVTLESTLVVSPSQSSTTSAPVKRPRGKSERRREPFMKIGKEIFEEHKSRVCGCLISQRSSRVLSYDASHRILLWDRSTLETLHSWNKPDLLDIAWKPNADTSFYCLLKSSVEKISTSTTAIMASADIECATSFCCTRDNNWLFVATNKDESPMIVCLTQDTLERDFTVIVQKIQSKITSISVNSQETLLCVGMENGDLFIVEPTKSALLLTLKVDSPINSCIFSSDQRYVFALSSDGKLSQWEGKKLRRQMKVGIKVPSMSVQGHYIVIGTEMDTEVVNSMQERGVPVSSKHACILLRTTQDPFVPDESFSHSAISCLSNHQTQISCVCWGGDYLLAGDCGGHVTVTTLVSV